MTIRLQFDGFDPALDAKLVALATAYGVGKWTAFEFDMVDNVRDLEFQFDKEEDRDEFVGKVQELDRGVRFDSGE